MKRLFTTMLIGFSAVSFANVEVSGPLDTKMFTKEVNENKSYYETLGEMFQIGSKPQISKLLGVMWSGRCFTKDSEYEPINGAYNFRRKSNLDVGPLGDSVVSYEAKSIWKRSAAPNYYDNQDMSVFKGEYYLVVESGTSLDIRFDKSISKLKYSGKYLIEEISETKHADVGPLGDDSYETSIRCYYFIPEYAR